MLATDRRRDAHAVLRAWTVAVRAAVTFSGPAFRLAATPALCPDRVSARIAAFMSCPGAARCRRNRVRRGGCGL